MASVWLDRISEVIGSYKPAGKIFHTSVHAAPRRHDCIFSHRLKSYLTVFAYPINLITMRTEAQLFKALADETHLKILWLLMEQRELNVTDFTAILDITQPKASRHLRTLYHAGLVMDKRDRLCVYYRIKAAPGAANASCCCCCGRCWQV